MKKIFCDKGSSMHRILAILEQVVLCNEHFRTERHDILMRLSGDVEETCYISIPD